MTRLMRSINKRQSHHPKYTLLGYFNGLIREAASEMQLITRSRCLTSGICVWYTNVDIELKSIRSTDSYTHTHLQTQTYYQFLVDGINIINGRHNTKRERECGVKLTFVPMTNDNDAVKAAGE